MHCIESCCNGKEGHWSVGKKTKSGSEGKDNLYNINIWDMHVALMEC